MSIERNLQTIWDALEDYRDEPDNVVTNDMWDEICTAMAQLREAMDVRSEVEEFYAPDLKTVLFNQTRDQMVRANNLMYRLKEGVPKREVKSFERNHAEAIQSTMVLQSVIRSADLAEEFNNWCKAKEEQIANMGKLGDLL